MAADVSRQPMSKDSHHVFIFLQHTHIPRSSTFVTAETLHTANTPLRAVLVTMLNYLVRT